MNTFEEVINDARGSTSKLRQLEKELIEAQARVEVLIYQARMMERKTPMLEVIEQGVTL